MQQPWSNVGQNGAEGQSNQWQSSYAFNNQNGQYEPHHWSQPMADQDAYSHLNAQDAPASSFYSSAPREDTYMAGSLHGAPSSQANFHHGHSSLPLNHHQQYAHSGQDVIDPSFNDIHPDLYGQQGKMNVGESMNHINQAQGHPHAHSQGYPQHGYQFQPQNEQPYESPLQQFAQPHVIPPQSRQQSHTPVQQYDRLQDAYGHGHNFSRPPQHSPAQSQSSYPQPAFSSPINGQSGQYQTNAPVSYQQSQPQQQQTPAYSQSPYAPQKPFNYGQPVQNQSPQAYQQPIGNRAIFAANAGTPSAAHSQYGTPQPPGDLDVGQVQPPAVEPTGKKRKRPLRSVADAFPSEPAVTHVDTTNEAVAKRLEEIDSLVPPIPSPEEAQMIAQFNDASKASQTKQSAINGLPHLVFDGTTRLPAPKSYDKLAPLVALPPRSSNPMVPELGYDLPCEVQGNFTCRYRPSVNKAGLDERRIEAKVLLSEYDNDMKALGRRRPKYTEYPHAFKEQLKSDEAIKNKAGKKAKKESEGERNKPIRAATRPVDPVEAAAWDIIGIVLIDQPAAKNAELIPDRATQVAEYVIKLRGEMNRAKQDYDQAVSDKEPEAEVSKLRQDLEQKKEALYRSLDALMEHADDDVLDRLGGNPKIVLSLVNVLISCHRVNDYSGKLPKIVLEVLAHIPMTKKIAETKNFEIVRKRYADRGDDEAKQFARDIAVNVKKALKAAGPETATGYMGTSAASRAKSAQKAAADGSTKRSRDDDSDSRTVKKIAVESTGGGSLSKKLAQPKLQLHSASKRVMPKTTSTILSGSSRPVAKSVPKSDGRHSDEKSRGEVKNGSHKSEGKPALTKSEPKAPAPKTSAPPSSSALSGIASLLDSINAPKAEAPVVVAKEPKAPEISETPEEKKKRLRKEARRKLRVSWKPEKELVQIKIFQKEETEDQGREGNMVRDAADDRSEGMVLKQRANAKEEEEDDEFPYQPWEAPTPIDFSTLLDETRRKSYVTRGGHVTFETDEQKRIAEREQRELVAIYTDINEIPPSPRSPPPEMVVDSDTTKIGQLPRGHDKFEEIQLRWRDEQQMGIDGALYAAVKRLDDKQNPSKRLDSILGRLQNIPVTSQSQQAVASNQHASSSSVNSNLPLVAGRGAADRVLLMLQSDRVKTWRDPNPVEADVWRPYNYPDATVRLSALAVEDVAKSLGGRPYPATSPPDWLKHDEEQVREWWVGHNKEVMARQKKADEDRARAESEASALLGAASNAGSGQAPSNPQDWAAYYAQQQQYAPYMAILQQMTGAQQPAPAQGSQAQISDDQMQTILAAINQPSQQQQPAQSAPTANTASYLNPNDPSYKQYMLLAQMAQGQASATQERDWERGEERGDYRERERERERDKRDGRHKRGPLPPHKPVNKALIGTKPCSFWQQGKCARGDKCTFRHD